MTPRQVASPPNLSAPHLPGWTLRTRSLCFGSLPLLMGIVNVTPDSFSDGGLFIDPAKAIDHGLQLVDEGADLLDVGGESTRPYSEPVPVDEELRRVMPVIQELCRRTDVPVSIDTSKARVAREAVAAGAELINDVTALEGDPKMLDAVRQSGAGVCLMHMQGAPQTMQDDPHYDDVVEDVGSYLADRRDVLIGEGIDRRRIALDPGIGFGKTHAHNLELLRNCHRLHRLGCPLLLGPSRKGFIAHVLGDKHTDRTHATIGVACSLAARHVQILRIHDVAAVRHGLTLFEAAGGWPK